MILIIQDSVLVMSGVVLFDPIPNDVLRNEIVPRLEPPWKWLFWCALTGRDPEGLFEEGYFDDVADFIGLEGEAILKYAFDTRLISQNAATSVAMFNGYEELVDECLNGNEIEYKYITPAVLGKQNTLVLKLIQYSYGNFDMNNLFHTIIFTGNIELLNQFKMFWNIERLIHIALYYKRLSIYQSLMNNRPWEEDHLRKLIRIPPYYTSSDVYYSTIAVARYKRECKNEIVPFIQAFISRGIHPESYMHDARMFLSMLKVLLHFMTPSKDFVISTIESESNKIARFMIDNYQMSYDLRDAINNRGRAAFISYNLIGVEDMILRGFVLSDELYHYSKTVSQCKFLKKHGIKINQKIIESCDVRTLEAALECNAIDLELYETILLTGFSNYMLELMEKWIHLEFERLYDPRFIQIPTIKEYRNAD